MRLVHNWHNWPQRWSVKIGIFASAITSVLIAWPDAAQNAWNALPPDLRSEIPPQYTPFIGIGLFVLSMFAQLIQQEKLQRQRGGGDAK